MNHKSEQLMFILSLVIILIGCFYVNRQKEIIIELRKMNIKKDFKIIEQGFDITEKNRIIDLKMTTLTDNEYVYPVDSPIITSGIGLRISPITGKRSVHYGTDMYSEKTMNVYAVQDGMVINHFPAPDGYHKGDPVFGGFVEIRHKNGLSSYAHMSETFVREGEIVKAGDRIGIIGETGLARGLHLHFSYLIDIFGGESER